MSSSVYIPAASSGGGSFTPPASISVKTASYTIPAGRYARIVAECDSGGTLTINAVTAITTAAFVNVDSSITNNNLTYTVPTGFLAKLTLTRGGNSFTINGNAAPADNIQYEFGPSGGVSIGTDVLGTKSIQGVAVPSNATNRQGQFFVPTGTVISGTGNWRALVEEYTV